MEPYSNFSGERRKYAGMLAAMDEAIGQIAAAIEKKGLRSKTLFLFSSDNGGPAPGRVTSNGPLRGAKGSLYEGGTRVAAFATWDGQIPAGSIVNEPLHIVDWYPTLVTLAGGSLEQKLPLDGRDAWPAIAHGKPSPHDAILLNTTPRNGAIRVGNWKLLLNGNVSDESPAEGDPAGAPQPAKKGKKKGKVADAPEKEAIELFDLANDPFEKSNLAEKMPDRVAELRRRLAAFSQQAAPPKSTPKAKDFMSPKIWGETQNP